jgi:hypothetical protein
MLQGMKKYAPEVSTTVEKKRDSDQRTLHLLHWDIEPPARRLHNQTFLILLPDVEGIPWLTVQ